MVTDIETVDKKILNIIQSAFPLVEEPFKQIGDELGESESEIIGRIQSMKDQNIIRQISAINECLGNEAHVFFRSYTFEFAFRWPNQCRVVTHMLHCLHDDFCKRSVSSCIVVQRAVRLDMAQGIARGNHDFL